MIDGHNQKDAQHEYITGNIQIIDPLYLFLQAKFYAMECTAVIIMKVRNL